jgi:hypothetical protein
VATVARTLKMHEQHVEIRLPDKAEDEEEAEVERRESLARAASG